MFLFSDVTTSMPGAHTVLNLHRLSMLVGFIESNRDLETSVTNQII